MNVNRVGNEKELRSVLSKIGVALVISASFELIMCIIIKFMTNSTNIADLGTLNFIITYPLVYIMLRHIPRQAVDKKAEFSRSYLFKLFLIAMFFSYIGNFMGNILSGLFSGNRAVNPVSRLILTDQVAIVALILCIGAPVFEELIFRKLFIDIIAPYSKKVAIVFTAFCFALFHGNLFQIFYAFGIGLLLGYIYIKSNKITYTIVIHSICNLLGGVMPMLIMNNIDNNKLLKIADLAQYGHDIPQDLLQSVLPSVCMFMIYILICLIIFAAGLVLFVKNRKKFNLKEFDTEPQSSINYSVFINAGTIAFTIGLVAVTVLNLIY